MTTTIKLTDTQRLVLEHAADQSDGRITWFPGNVKGGARQKVVDGLFSRALITSIGIHDCFITSEGYDALGRARPMPTTARPNPEPEANVAPVEAGSVGEAAPWFPEARVGEIVAGPVEIVTSPIDEKVTTAPTKPVRSRDNSKQAQVVAMLKRPSGATIADICAVTGWQQHTARGFFAGAVKKKLGLTLVSEKIDQGERVYRTA